MLPTSKEDIAMPGIGILSPVPYTAPFQTAFDQGLNMPGVSHRNLQVDLGYAGLAGGLALLLADGAVDLIAAVGGMRTEQATTNWNMRNYISLVGRPAGGAGGHFKGRVDLGSVANNNARRIHLKNGHGIPFNQQALLSNSTSAMSGPERLPTAPGIPWPHIEALDLDETDNTSAGRRQKYVNAFSAIPVNIKAIVISADPFYKKWSNELVFWANQWVVAGPSRRICYPFQEYQSDSPQPGLTCLYGPRLVEAYGFLGQLAAHAISSDGHPAPGQLPQYCNHVLQGNVLEPCSHALVPRVHGGSLLEAVRETIESKPYTAVTVALAVGWIIGRLGRRY
jgi:hypothetical protein